MSKPHVVYTCITGGYDSLREVKFRSKDIDYICFTDNVNLKSSTWEVRPLPESVVSPSDKALTSVKKQRLVKLLPHKFLSEYSDSLWIDSNIEVVGDLADFFSQYSFSQKFLFTNKHPTRNCIYKEELACLRLKKDTYENMQPQIDRYLSEGYPKDNGLVETNILLRNHNDPKCKKLMSLWAEEILDGSHRDQLSYNYCVWKLGYESYVGFLGQKYSNLRFSDNAFFKLNGGHIKISDYVPFDSRSNVTDKIETIVERKPEVVKESEKKEEIAKEDQTEEKPKRNPFDLFKVTWDKAKAEVSLETVEEKKEEKKIEPFKKKDPLVSVVFFTHERTRVARYCLKKLIENLKYENLRWIISDDRSHEGHVEELLEELKSHGISDVTVCRTTEEKHGLGASMNNGLKEAFKNSEVVLRVEDDWLLEKELQLKKHVDVLLKNKNTAGIRIGMVGGGVDENEKMKFSGYKTLCGSDVKSWLFVNQVFLVHKRIHDAIGCYIEDKNADKVEVDFRERYNSFSKNGREKQFVLVPNEMKWRTFDDPSLWFFHVGRSMLGHSVYKPPKRYEWLYETSEKKQTAEEPTQSYKDRFVSNLVSRISSNAKAMETPTPLHLKDKNSLDLIVSLTTYKPRLLEKNLPNVLDTILKQKTDKNFKIAVTLHKDDLQYVSKELETYFTRNNIEKLIVDKNLKPHLKYFYAMQKWRDVPILTIDDDCLYFDDLIESLWKGYEKHPDCVLARRTHLMMYFKNGWCQPYSEWKSECTSVKEPSYDLLATGVGGVLYPPDILKISDEDLLTIEKCILNDDVFLKWKENQLKVKVLYCPGSMKYSYKPAKGYAANYALCYKNVTHGNNDKVAKAIDLKKVV